MRANAAAHTVVQAAQVCAGREAPVLPAGPRLRAVAIAAAVPRAVADDKGIDTM